jgi:hypothetical protein
MCTDTSLDAIEIIRVYGLRFKIICSQPHMIFYVATDEMWRVRDRTLSMRCFVEHLTPHMIVWMIGAHHHEGGPINA